LLLNHQNLCSNCTQWLRHDATADSGINDQLTSQSLVSQHSFVDWMCFELISQLFCCLLFSA